MSETITALASVVFLYLTQLMQHQLKHKRLFVTRRMK